MQKLPKGGPEPCRMMECECYDSERGSVWIRGGLCGQVREVRTVSAFCLFIKLMSGQRLV